MAKKKLTHHQSNDYNPDNVPQSQLHTHSSHSHQPSNVDDSSEKLRTLKNLNAFLIKETTERRLQVESLLHDKEALESAFNRSAMEKRDLEFQLSEAALDNVGLDLERSVILVYVETQITEMGFLFDRLVCEKNDIERAKAQGEDELVSLKEELSKVTVRLENQMDLMRRLSRERDDMKIQFDVLVDEANGLKEKVIEAEKKEGALGNQVEKLRMESEKLREEKDQKEGAIRELTTDRDLALKKSAESATVIEKLKGEIDVISRGKFETEEQKKAQDLKVIGLELELKKLNESLKNTQREEAALRTNILEYEKTVAQAMEKEKGMEMDIRTLLKAKEEDEQSMKTLTERRDNTQKVLDMVQKELEEKQHCVDEAIRVKNEIEQVKVIRENEIVELHEEVYRLKTDMLKLKESWADLEEKNKQLVSEVDHYRSTAEEATLEKENIRKEFEEEKNKVKNLMLEVAGMEDKIEETAAELGEMRSEREKLIERKGMMESRVDVLMKEKDVLHRSLVEAQRGSDDLRAKIESSNQALALLKNTAAALVRHSQSDTASVEGVVSVEKKLDEDIATYAEDLDAIKNAFKNKNKMVDDMKLQLASLENSVTEAQKRKSFWTVISSATTIFAAALAAYVARGR